MTYDLYPRPAIPPSPQQRRFAASVVFASVHTPQVVSARPQPPGHPSKIATSGNSIITAAAWCRNIRVRIRTFAMVGNRATANADLAIVDSNKKTHNGQHHQP